MWVAMLNNHTTVHEDHLICNITRKGHLMRDNNHCGILLRKGTDVSTSQPSLVDVAEMWKEMLKEYEEIVYIPLSSALSGSCMAAMAMANEDEFAGKVFVVDNGRVATPMHRSVLDAVEMTEKGYSAAEIKKILEETREKMTIYIGLSTLEYLKKGGRITPAAAAIGTVLNLKPVLQIQGEKLDAYAKVRGKKQAKRVMMKAMQEDWDTRFKKYVESGEMCLQIAYAGNKEEAEEFKKEVQAAFPGMDIHMDPLSLSVACHIGHGALAVACSKKVTV